MMMKEGGHAFKMSQISLKREGESRRFLIMQYLKGEDEVQHGGGEGR